MKKTKSKNGLNRHKTAKYHKCKKNKTNEKKSYYVKK